METKKIIRIIDIQQIATRLWAKRKLLFFIITTTFIVAYTFIFCVPRYYTCEIKLAPEYNTDGNAISSIKSSLGLDLGNNINRDAIAPYLYPDLIQSPDFIVKLFSIKINYLNNKSITYYDYLSYYQKSPFWSKLLQTSNVQDSQHINAFNLTKEQHKIAETIKNNIKCSVDRKTDVISFAITDQSPIIAAELADSIRCKLQEFITEYRTNKARTDLEYFNKLTLEAKKQYEQARQKYAAYSDANQDIQLQSFISKREELENDMQLKFNTYSSLSNQLQSAKAKVQEKTPAFTILQSASVPDKPTGPKRTLFALIVTIAVFLCTAFCILRKDFFVITTE